jgi:hypothetical protein
VGPPSVTLPSTPISFAPRATLARVHRADHRHPTTRVVTLPPPTLRLTFLRQWVVVIESSSCPLKTPEFSSHAHSPSSFALCSATVRHWTSHRELPLPFPKLADPACLPLHKHPLKLLWPPLFLGQPSAHKSLARSGRCRRVPPSCLAGAPPALSNPRESVMVPAGGLVGLQPPTGCNTREPAFISLCIFLLWMKLFYYFRG